MNHRILLAEKLRAAGISSTSQRLDIAEITLSEPKHSSADEVLTALKKDGARVSKATVYNTLNLFCDKGLLKTVVVDPERQYYDSTTHDHHHIYNIDTGELIDVNPEHIQLSVDVKIPENTLPAGTEVILKVKCQ